MKRLGRNEPRYLYFNDDEVFLRNTVGEKKAYDHNEWGLFLARRTCICMKSLAAHNPRNELFREERDKICNELYCDPLTGLYAFSPRLHLKECLLLEKSGYFFEFQNLKKEMLIETVESNENNKEES